MPTYIALLRAVNVGGTGALPMQQLRAMCASIGCENVRTYIASGNVIFQSRLSARTLSAALAKRLHAHFGKSVGVFLRTHAELSAVLKHNPFKAAAPNRTVVIFLAEPPAPTALKDAVGQKNEEMRLGTREIFVHYVDGIGASKLKIPAAHGGTARNLNTIAKLVAMAGETTR